MNRVGRFSGKVLGAGERVTAMQALKMVTIDAAYTLGVEDRVGSIRTGKLADFTVLDRSPLAVESMAIRDIPVWGIVVGGVKHPVTDIAPRPAVKAAAWGTEPMAPHGAPRAFGGRYANAAALQDPRALSQHLSGCSMEFWRTMAREQGPLVIVPPSLDSVLP